jgi:hypothetical protein
MIKEKFYTKQEGRDPKKYLGIDGFLIPFEHFKGVYNDEGLVFTDDAMYGIQFIVDKDGVILLTTNKDLYVTEEDLQTDKWHKIGQVLSEYSTHICGTINEYCTSQTDVSKEYQQVLDRYYSGEIGKIGVEYKDYNDKGEYMWKSFGIDTTIEPGIVDPRDVLLKHINFAYYLERQTPIELRYTEVRTNLNNMIDLASRIVPEEHRKSENIIPLGPIDKTSDVKMTLIYPPFGKVDFIEDNSIPGMHVIVKRKDNE